MVSQKRDKDEPKRRLTQPTQTLWLPKYNRHEHLQNRDSFKLFIIFRLYWKTEHLSMMKMMMTVSIRSNLWIPQCFRDNVYGQLLCYTLQEWIKHKISTNEVENGQPPSVFSLTHPNPNVTSGRADGQGNFVFMPIRIGESENIIISPIDSRVSHSSTAVPNPIPVGSLCVSTLEEICNLFHEKIAHICLPILLDMNPNRQLRLTDWFHSVWRLKDVFECTCLYQNVPRFPLIHHTHCSRQCMNSVAPTRQKYV